MSQTWKIVLIAAAFVALPVLYTLEIPYLNRTLHVGQLMRIALVLGLLLGAFIGYRLQKHLSEPVARFRAYAASIILAVLTLPLLASWSNRLLSVHPIQPVSVEFVEESPRYSSRFGASETASANAYLTFFYKEQELFKIQTPQSLFPQAQRGDKVLLPIRKGLWGFEFVAQRLR